MRLIEDKKQYFINGKFYENLGGTVSHLTTAIISNLTSWKRRNELCLLTFVELKSNVKVPQLK